MGRKRRLAAVIMVLIMGLSTISYEVRAEDGAAILAEQGEWGIRNVLDVSECRQGDTVTLSIYMEGNYADAQQNISFLNGILEYDNSLFSVTKADILPTESGKVQAWSFDPDSCLFEIQYDSDISVQNDGLLLQIRLNVEKNASVGKTTVCVTHMNWSDSSGTQAIELEHHVPAQIIIEESETDVMPGDVNQDGRVDLIDVKVIMQYYNGKKNLNSQQKLNADVNKDGKVNLLDAKQVMRYYNNDV